MKRVFKKSLEVLAVLAATFGFFLVEKKRVLQKQLRLEFSTVRLEISAFLKRLCRMRLKWR